MPKPRRGGRPKILDADGLRLDSLILKHRDEVLEVLRQAAWKLSGDPEAAPDSDEWIAFDTGAKARAVLSKIEGEEHGT